MLFDQSFAGAGPGQGLHFSVQLNPAVLEDWGHAILLNFHFQANKVGRYLSLDILYIRGSEYLVGSTVAGNK